MREIVMPARALGVVLMLATGLVVACDDEPAGDVEPTRQPSSTAAARFSRLAGTCPTFTGGDAEKLGVSGEGRPQEPAYSPVPGFIEVACEWPAAGTNPFVSVLVLFHPDGYPPSDGNGNAKRVFENKRADADAAATSSDANAVKTVETPWGPAFTEALPLYDTVVQRTLVDNVVISVVIRDRERFTENLHAERDDLLRRFSGPVFALTGEVVDDLR